MRLPVSECNMLVDFPLMRAPHGEMSERSNIIGRVHAYWDGLRRNGALPQRADIDPRALPGCLANSFLIERVSAGISRFRLAGAVLSEVMGMDVRGMPFLALIEPAERTRMAERMEQMYQDPSILELVLESDGNVRLGARVVLLPVQSVHGVDMALGCFQSDGLFGNAPRRFRTVRALTERILDSQAQPAGFAEPAAAFTGPTKRPGLRLVYSSGHKISHKDHKSE